MSSKSEFDSSYEYKYKTNNKHFSYCDELVGWGLAPLSP